MRWVSIEEYVTSCPIFPSASLLTDSPHTESKCDGPANPSQPCSPCRTASIECTYLSEATRRAHPKGYVEALELQFAKARALLSKAFPDVDLEERVGNVLSSGGFERARRGGRMMGKEKEIDEAEEEEEERDSDSDGDVTRITSAFGEIDVEEDISKRYLGKSSSFHLIR